MHLQGRETSLNPLGLVTALVGAMRHAARVNQRDYEPVRKFTQKLLNLIH